MFTGIGLIFLFRNAEVVAIPKRERDDKESVIQHILTSIEDHDFSKIMPLNEICFDTNIRKIKHAEY